MTAVWYGDKNSQTLVNEHNGRVLATIQHDGDGKHAVAVFTSIFSYVFWRALEENIDNPYIFRHHPSLRWQLFGWLMRMRSAGLPYVCIWMGDQKASHPAALRRFVEEMFGLDMYRGREVAA